MDSTLHTDRVRVSQFGAISDAERRDMSEGIMSWEYCKSNSTKPDQLYLNELLKTDIRPSQRSSDTQT